MSDLPLNELIRRYLNGLKMVGYMESTMEVREAYLRWFTTWCHHTGRSQVSAFKRDDIQQYKTYLSHYRRVKDGEHITLESQKKRLFAVFHFFRWLTKTDHLLNDPTEGLTLPKPQRTASQPTLTIEEMETLLAQPDLTTSTGLRNRALLETLYSTGIRSMEMSKAVLTDLDIHQGLLYIPQGKGGDSRLVPIGMRATNWIDKYLLEVRPLFNPRDQYPHLFISKTGGSLTPSSISEIVRRYKKEAGIEKQGGAHLFRHTAATLMMENGADMLSVQAFLGHKKLQTTEIYTRVSKEKLKEVYLLTHPAAYKKKIE